MEVIDVLVDKETTLAQPAKAPILMVEIVVKGILPANRHPESKILALSIPGTKGETNFF
jgi:hypothetical protein